MDGVGVTHVLPLASLEPGVLPTGGSQIAAIVTLVWPYSSSTRTTALLLAEPDFRLRRKKGQIRVNFTGPSAQKVGSSAIGIGDSVRLDLAGSQWQPSASDVSTPGRSVGGELMYHNRLSLNVNEPLFSMGCG